MHQDKRDLDIWGNPLTPTRQKEKDVEFGRWPCCVNCLYWNKSPEGCSKAGGATPPARVIVLGCKAWEWENDLPF